jgi:hypothetical protein
MRRQGPLLPFLETTEPTRSIEVVPLTATICAELRHVSLAEA